MKRFAPVRLPALAGVAWLASIAPLVSAAPLPTCSAPVFADYTTSSQYVRMPDGVRLAVDVILPAGVPAGARIATVLMQTRYWRAFDLSPAAGDPRLWDWRHPVKLYLAQRGYAVVVADVRGTGASYGVNPRPWSAEEIRDGGALVDWIAAQPWSNGRVGGYGVSYEGTSAQLLAVSNRPALKAVVPQFMEYDVYRHIAFPGGVMNDRFVREWSAQNLLLDANQPCDDADPYCSEIRQYLYGVKPVDADLDRAQLAEAVREHEANPDVYQALQEITYRDDFSSILQSTIDDFSVHRFRDAIARSKVAIFGWGSWMDAATAEAVLNRLATLPNPQQAIIGPWNHGATQDADPYHAPDTPVMPDPEQQLCLVTRFLDHYLKGIPNGAERDPRLLYYTMGEGEWKAARAWPVPGTVKRRLFLSEGQTLRRRSPTRFGSDTYAVDFATSTGALNRWFTEIDMSPVVYPDRAEEDRRLLTYTSAPLERDTEITGSPLIQLFVSSSHEGGAFFVYLEDVDEQGRVRYVTEGELRALDRRVVPYSQGYVEWGPHHSYQSADGAALIPERTASLRFALNPVSVLIRKGHRVRVAIAGQDASMFARVPATGDPTLQVYRGGRLASYLELPIVPRR
jgi:putative CocE/NonD family hydrolase